MSLFKLAIRHLLARPKQTILIYLGVSFGSIAFVVITGFFMGFQGFLVDQLVNNDAHIKISAREEVLSDHTMDEVFYAKDTIFWQQSPSGRKTNLKINDMQSWYAILNSDPRVEAFSSHLTTQANLVQRGQYFPINVVGIIPSQLEKVSTLKDYVTYGSLTTLSKGGGNLLIGDGISKKTGARPGQTLYIEIPGKKALPFKVSGIFKTGMQILDDNRVYGYLPEMQLAAGRLGQINEIAIRLHDYEYANTLASTWSQFSEDKIMSWDQISANFLSVFKIQNALRTLVISVLTIVSGFGVYNVLNMVVNQKKKEIAILRSMGFLSKHVLFLFLSQGFVVGLLGGITGLIVGYFVSLYLETIPFGASPIGGGVGHLIISFNPWIYFFAVFISMFSSTLAGYLPARAAGKMTPIEIIRSGGDS